ncbi:MAG: hypothetical protein ND807_14020 [Vicinamibacterales bacterium]|nr:hypothetical protein [Vicinamibacterales bacterium]
MLQIGDIHLSDVSAGGATKLPATLLWDLSFDWRAIDKSTTTCTADVRDSSNVVVARFAILVGSSTSMAKAGVVIIGLPSFRVTAAGTYVVRLYVGEQCVWTKSVLVG